MYFIIDPNNRPFKGGSKALEEYNQFCLNTEIVLGRELEQRELEFLSWLYNRYLEEQQLGAASRPQKSEQES